ncbi:MAG: hypothetical protein AUJ01_07260 [Acidobacteria bacterium 13_1_40CM_3_65_5]|nr:MAG: hypothetical protein AUJ01_07260 [Acidobacteria bacterium 13_1_40CM_3_65_5]
MEARRRIEQGGVASELIAARLRNHVDPHAAGLAFGGAAGDLVHHLLKLAVVVIDERIPAPIERAHDVQAVDFHRQVGAGPAVHDQHALLHRVRSSDVEAAHAQRGQRRANPLEAPPCRQRVQQVAREHLALRRRLHVDERRGARDGDCFLDGSDLHLRVHGRREVRLEGNPFTPHGLESRQLEGDQVRAWPEIDDAVRAGTIADRSPRPFDQRRAAGGDGHAREHGAARIPHDPADRALRQRRAGCREHPDRGKQRRPQQFARLHLALRA